MPSTSDGGGAALDAQVETADSQPDIDQVARAEAEAAQAEAECAAIEEKLTGWKQSLSDKKAEAKRLRAEARAAAKDGDK